MTEKIFLQQLYLLREDMEKSSMMMPGDMQQRDRWIVRLDDLISRRVITIDAERIQA